ncbi:MFS transporter [Thalassobacillus sp. C254]|uniref:MFS transporter n=1 Tax=Thalassobacillus sp. C254 TaxID=1225341 RepID=UPI000B32D821|nr:MFS transporter [Thalassobacillus sp. C254]
MSREPLWSKNFICISLCNLFIFLAFYYLIVTLPIYTLQELHGTSTQAGLLVTVFLIAAIIVRPFAGKWALTAGNHRLLFAGLAIFLISSLLYLFIDSITGLMAVRLIHGAAFGMATTATGGIVTSVIPDSRRGEGMGYYSLSFNLAVVSGPFLGLTAIYQWSSVVFFGIVVLCSVMAVVMAMILTLPETSSRPVKDVNPERKRTQLFEKTAMNISIVAALFAIIYSSVLSFVPVYSEEIGLLQASSYFFVVYAAVMLLSRPFTGRWLDEHGANIIVYPSIITFAVGMFLLSMSDTTALFLLSAALIGLGWGTLFPTFQTIAVQNAQPERRG